MTEDLENRIEALENGFNVLTQKINEIVGCLEDNELFRKVSVDYVYTEEMPEEETAEEETVETPEEETKEETEAEAKEEAKEETKEEEAEATEEKKE